MLKNIEKKRNVLLKNYCTFKIGRKAKIIYFPKNNDELIELLNKKNKLFILGNGSNILFPDSRFETPIICTKKLNKMFVKGDCVFCEAGASLFELCMFCQKHGLSGLEKLYGIPATVGGAIVMNAGAFGEEICSKLKSFKIFKKNGEIIEKKNFRYAYRKGPVEDDEILLSAIFKLKKEKKSKILNEMMEIFQKRKTLQPYNYPSAGSVFKRGENFLPAKLIDEWGLKGLKVGGACVSDKHAGFIINIKNASSNDVKKLIEEIERNASQHGFVFEKEIKVLK